MEANKAFCLLVDGNYHLHHCVNADLCGIISFRVCQCESRQPANRKGRPDPHSVDDGQRPQAASILRDNVFFNFTLPNISRT